MNLFSRLCLTACTLGLALEVGAKSATEVFEEVSGSMAVVYGKDRKGQVVSLGSGVVLAAGEVVTNCHVIDEVSDLSVRHKDSEHPATRKHSDFDRDVCSLTVPGLKASVAQLGTTQALKVGQRVYVIGAPHGLELTLSEGIISSLREVEGGRYIQITAPISAGSSGGGLFDEEGRLIGLPTFYLSEGQQLNFAVPVEWVKALPQREAAANQAATDFTAWVKKAIELRDKEDWAGLLQHAQRETQARPSSDAAWQLLGDAYHKTGQIAKAIDAYKKALSIYPDFATVWVSLGFAYEKAGQWPQAIEAFHHALRIKPDDAPVWYSLGLAYTMSDQPVKAIEAYQQAVRINRDFAQVWSALGLAYRRTAQTARAIEAFQQAVRINPNDAGAWDGLGDTYKHAGQTARAIKAYRKAVSIDPDDASLWYSLGEAYSLEGRRGEMMEVYRRLKALDTHFADKFFNTYILR